MESVRSHLSRSDILYHEDVDPDDSGQEEQRCASLFTAETLQNGGEIPQRIRVSAMTELKEFSGKDRDEDRARSWISKVKSAFPHNRRRTKKMFGIRRPIDRASTKLIQPTQSIYTAQVEAIAGLFYDTVWKARCVCGQPILS